MMDYLNIGAVPSGEDCLSAGHANAKQEARIYRRQLEREFPDGAFVVKSFPHDFGIYYEVVALYSSPEDTPMSQAAWDAESSAAEFWDAQAKAELMLLKDQSRLRSEFL